jgi:hypothetical protein
MMRIVGVPYQRYPLLDSGRLSNVGDGALVTYQLTYGVSTLAYPGVGPGPRTYCISTVLPVRSTNYTTMIRSKITTTISVQSHTPYPRFLGIFHLST